MGITSKLEAIKRAN
jgi:hypothetical protein